MHSDLFPRKGEKVTYSPISDRMPQEIKRRIAHVKAMSEMHPDYLTGAEDYYARLGESTRVQAAESRAFWGFAK
jgi:hypothetical protein